MLYGEKMNQILEKFGVDTSTNTKVIYFNKNCEI